jgi:DNA repair exonuclease SbcCD nuclease subunit
MRFVHAADIHLDSPLQGLALQDAAQIELMRRATRDAFERMIDLCIERQVAFLVLAGDLYDCDCPNMQIAVFLRNQLARLDKAKIRVVIKKGNHDADNKITSALALPQNTRVFSDQKPETIQYDDLPVRVALHGQSFKPGPINHNLAASYPSPVKDCLNIGVLHTSLVGNPDHSPYAPCKLEELKTHGYDYWALGHIHKGEELARDPWVVYPGNIQGRHAKETGPKGCILVETDDNRIVSAEAIALDVVRWQQILVNLEDAKCEGELVERIRVGLTQTLRNANGRPSAVRITLKGRTLLHSRVARMPSRFRQTVLELAGEIAGDDIWVEKIRNSTTAPPMRFEGSPDEGAGELIRIVREITGGTAQVGTLLGRELEPLRMKLPEELKEVSPLKVLDDPAIARQALVRIGLQLVSRLEGEGET